MGSRIDALTPQIAEIERTLPVETVAGEIRDWKHGSITKLGRRNIRNHEVEVHVDERGPHVHIDRASDDIYVNLRDCSTLAEAEAPLPRVLREEPTIQRAIEGAIDTWKTETGR